MNRNYLFVIIAILAFSVATVVFLNHDTSSNTDSPEEGPSAPFHLTSLSCNSTDNTLRLTIGYGQRRPTSYDEFLHLWIRSTQQQDSTPVWSYEVQTNISPRRPEQPHPPATVTTRSGQSLPRQNITVTSNQTNTIRMTITTPQLTNTTINDPIQIRFPHAQGNIYGGPCTTDLAF